LILEYEPSYKVMQLLHNTRLDNNICYLLMIHYDDAAAAADDNDNVADIVVYCSFNIHNIWIFIAVHPTDMSVGARVLYGVNS
jgi:hypothetical protein